MCTLASRSVRQLYLGSPRHVTGSDQSLVIAPQMTSLDSDSHEELTTSGTSGTSQNVSRRHHSLMNIQANNLLRTHDLNTRLRVDNSSVNLYFRHEFKLNLLVIRHEFAVDSLIVRHKFTKTHLWLGMSLQKLSFY
ncbi:hypothetical protein F2Q70_00018719 [Brassica cretica]|uniref:Uncharacterized protein n=1 Tax=Brassica cretica TaxID=69181 RepID=A0A8S9HWZ4_BRACR|nr:hypothetical protein F2Q70_00018719 [Brassica cretica]